MERFEGRTAIVTGGSSGIGLAIAKRLGEEGARVVVAALGNSSLEGSVQQVKTAGAPDAFAFACNVSDEAMVEATVKACLDRFGRLDVVVNNAGMMLFSPLEDFTQDNWLKVLSVDLLGAMHFTRQALRHMTNGGEIVNIASVHAVMPTPNVAPFAVSLVVLLSLFCLFAIEGKAKHVRANAILPGAIDTPMLWENPNLKSGAEKLDPKDVGKPEHIAAATAFLASDDAAFVTGASLAVDGGRLAQL